MNGFDINSLINIAGVIVAIIFFLAKLDNMTKSNREFYENTIKNLHETMKDKFQFLETNMNEKFNSVDNKFEAMKHDIARLEHKQEESNKIKERLAVVEYTIRTAPKNSVSEHFDAYDSLRDGKNS